MKKIISMITLVAMVVTMCSVSAFAYDCTLTMSSDATDNKANAGDEVIVTVTAGTTNGMKALGFKITFDPNDIEVGTSAKADQAAIDYAEYIGTPGFETLDAVTKSVLGYPSYVDDTYYETYASLSPATKKFGDPTFGYEALNGEGLVTFGYATDTAKNPLTKVEPFMAGAAVLRVKTAEAKQTTITITQATAAGADGVDTPCTIANTITLDLNGYTAGGEGDDDTVTATAADTNETVGVTAYTIANDANVSKVITKTFENVTITEATRVTAVKNGELRVFGSDLYSKLGGVTIGKLTFGIIVDSSVEASEFTTFAIN